MAGPAVTEPRAVIGRAPIEAPCPALAGLEWDRESSKCKEVIHLIVVRSLTPQPR